MAELTHSQFDLIAALIQSKLPVKEAARLVLVEGKTNPEARAAVADPANKIKVSPQSLSNTLGRFRRTHQDIKAAYKIRK